MISPCIFLLDTAARQQNEAEMPGQRRRFCSDATVRYPCGEYLFFESF
jgi:hypothetical protein